jgi:hypothetical protein
MLFFKTQIISASYLLFNVIYIILITEKSYDNRDAIIGVCLSFSLVIVLTTLVARERWVTIFCIYKLYF